MCMKFFIKSLVIALSISNILCMEQKNSVIPPRSDNNFDLNSFNVSLITGLVAVEENQNNNIMLSYIKLDGGKDHAKKVTVPFVQVHDYFKFFVKIKNDVNKKFLESSALKIITFMDCSDLVSSTAQTSDRETTIKTAVAQFLKNPSEYCTLELMSSMPNLNATSIKSPLDVAKIIENLIKRLPSNKEFMQNPINQNYIKLCANFDSAPWHYFKSPIKEVVYLQSNREKVLELLSKKESTREELEVALKKPTQLWRLLNFNNDESRLTNGSMTYEENNFLTSGVLLPGK